ncbi:MAG: hypothetical protein LBJ81_01395 [Puniceicoccales bacterium]|jgi:serine/threonine protein kinase|nr:hypothetical protein [Puniceicoccales bacterium]
MSLRGLSAAQRLQNMAECINNDRDKSLFAKRGFFETDQAFIGRIQTAPPGDANGTRLRGNASVGCDWGKIGQAESKLTSRISDLGTPGLFQFNKKRSLRRMNRTLAELSDLRRLSSMSDPEKFRTGHLSSPLDSVTSGVKVKRRKELGRGGLGVVYAGTAAGQDVVVKKAKIIGNADHDDCAKVALKDEAAAGQVLRSAGANITKDTLLSDVQGIAVAVIPEMRGDQLVQERVNGVDGFEAIQGGSPAFRDGFVDDPQRAIGRAAELALGLHGMHQAGQIHHDLKPQNIMVEEQRTPSGEAQYGFRIIDLGAAKRRGEHADIRSVNMAPEHLAAEKKFNEVRQQYAAYTAECQNRGIPMDSEKIADFRVRWNAAQAELAATNAPAYDMYTLGTMLPGLFFGACQVQGYDGQPVSLTKMFDQECWSMPDASGITQPSQQIQRSEEMFARCRAAITPEEIRQNPEVQRLGEELNQKLIELNGLTDPYGSNAEKRESLSREIAALRGQIASAPDGIRDGIARQRAQGELRGEILTRFQQMNAAMYQATGKFYPQEALERLASMTADCLAMDPEMRPSAEQVLLGLQNMTYANWSEGNYGWMSPPETDDETKTQGQFSWINPLKGEWTPPSPMPLPSSPFLPGAEPPANDSFARPV